MKRSSTKKMAKIPTIQQFCHSHIRKQNTSLAQPSVLDHLGYFNKAKRDPASNGLRDAVLLQQWCHLLVWWLLHVAGPQDEACRP